MHTNTLSVVLKGSITTDMMFSKFKSFPFKNAYKTLHSSNLTTPSTFFLGHYWLGISNASGKYRTGLSFSMLPPA